MVAATGGVPLNITTAWDSTNNLAALWGSAHHGDVFFDDYTISFTEKVIFIQSSWPTPSAYPRAYFVVKGHREFC